MMIAWAEGSRGWPAQPAPAHRGSVDEEQVVLRLQSGSVTAVGGRPGFPRFLQLLGIAVDSFHEYCP